MRNRDGRKTKQKKYEANNSKQQVIRPTWIYLLKKFFARFSKAFSDGDDTRV
jgi:hypothetical protein